MDPLHEDRRALSKRLAVLAGSGVMVATAFSTMAAVALGNVEQQDASLPGATGDAAGSASYGSTTAGPSSETPPVPASSDPGTPNGDLTPAAGGETADESSRAPRQDRSGNREDTSSQNPGREATETHDDSDFTPSPTEPSEPTDTQTEPTGPTETQTEPTETQTEPTGTTEPTDTSSSETEPENKPEDETKNSASGNPEKTTDRRVTASSSENTSTAPSSGRASSTPTTA